MSELKECLKERGLSTMGLKAVLYNRLEDSMENEENNSDELAKQDKDCEEEESKSES